jgi:signal transduction histidine kinase
MSQRTRLLAVFALAVLPLAALSTLDIVQELRESESRVAEDRVDLARLLAFAAEAFIDGQLASAKVMTLQPAVRSARATSELDTLLRRVADANPLWAGVGIVGPDGASLAGSLGPGTVFVGDRPYFREALATGRPVVSNALVGRRTGRVTVALAVPFTSERGERAVLTVTLPTDRFRAGLLAKLGRTPARPTVIDREGQIIAGAEAGGEGKLVSVHGPEVSAVLAGETGSEIIERAGVPTLVAYAPVGDYGFGALMAEPVASAFAAARREAWQRTAVLGVILVTIGALAWALGGRLSQLYQRALDARAQAEHLTGELRHALATRDDFLASAAHDLRNPLATVRGAADLLERTFERGEVPRERLAAGLAHIQSASRRIAGMLDAFLDLAQLQLGRPLELRKELQDAAALAREVVAEWQHSSTRHRIRLAAPDELMAVVDGPRLQRVMDNLVGNAVKYSPEGGDVDVDLREETGQIVFSVRDRGIGIPPSEVEAVFERFRRGSNVAGRFSGTGIGLAGARRIVELHGGSVEVKSALGSGSTFTVRLPTARP